MPSTAARVLIGIQLTFAACGAVTIVNDHILHLHVAVQGVDGHFGLDFKAAAQHRVGFDKLVAEGAEPVMISLILPPNRVLPIWFLMPTGMDLSLSKVQIL